MSIYRIYPEKDSFISSEKPSSNSGLDEILEIGGYTTISGEQHTLRTLVKFNNNEIKDTINNIVTSTYESNLHLTFGTGNELPTNFTLYGYPVSEDWDQGTGKFDDQPVTTNGVSWEHKDLNQTNEWDLSNETSEFYLVSGGGTWNELNETTQSFNVDSNLDINMDVTSIVNGFYDGSIPNNGLILKLSSSLEYQSGSNIRLKYFGKDTNTIYPPYLEFKWDDSTFDNGDLEILDNTVNIVTINNNKGEYIDQGSQRFRIHSTPRYPERTFTTSSIFLNTNVLPEESYWGLRDEDSEEMIIDFDPQYTKISCDPLKGSYFDIYLNSLQPERYYRILIKSTIDGSTVVIDNDNIFKVTRNG